MKRNHLLLIVTLSAIALVATAASFTSTSEFKSKSFKPAIIKDYSNLTTGRGVDWMWIRPGFRISSHNIKVRNFKNLGGAGPRVMSELNKLNSEFAGHQDSDRATLVVEAAVYRVVHEGRSGSGVGVELIFRNSKQWQIAKVRHFEEGDPVEAAEDIVDKMEEFADEN